jgi:hypothetical protein
MVHDGMTLAAMVGSRTLTLLSFELWGGQAACGNPIEVEMKKAQSSRGGKIKGGHATCTRERGRCRMAPYEAEDKEGVRWRRRRVVCMLE